MEKVLLGPVVKNVNSLCSPEALQQVVPQMWVIVMKACLAGGFSYYIWNDQEA